MAKEYVSLAKHQYEIGLHEARLAVALVTLAAGQPS